MALKFRIALLASAGGAAIAFASPAFADATVDCNVGAGALSTECGIAATASGDSSTALGNTAVASGLESTATGQASTASGESSTAVGISSTASGLQSVAVGNRAQATNEDSAAFGDKALATGFHSTAIGGEAVATGAGSQAFGWRANATGAQSAAVGNQAQATGTNSTALGNLSQATGITMPRRLATTVSPTQRATKSAPERAFNSPGKIVIAWAAPMRLRRIASAPRVSGNPAPAPDAVRAPLRSTRGSRRAFRAPPGGERNERSGTREPLPQKPLGSCSIMKPAAVQALLSVESAARKRR
ncbi:MAG: trimeric autotransporter adhesin [Sphingomonadales bacterium]|nr:trimeric autotransporter adhesin [Sphingomonadales bacterium]